MSLPAINGERAGGPWRGGPSPPSHKKKQLRSRDASPAPGANNDDGFPNDGTEDVANNTMGNNGARRDASDFRILVAARIRPFTEREVRQWRLEQRSNAAAAAQDDADEARRARAALRQPFGPAHKSLNATQTGLDGTWRGRLDLDNHDSNGGAGHDAFALDGDEHPPPAVEVESDGRTVVLLDVQHHSPTEAAASAAVRNAFTYDYVYSSFAPNVELDVHLPDAYGHTRGRAHAAPSSSSASASSPYVILDSEDGAARGGTGGGFRHNTAQEQQAEAEQMAIYEQLAVPLVDAALRGYNTCMFAYGQTGSGKTYTMMGTQRHPGLIPRLCQHLFEEVAARNHHIGGGDRRAGASSTSSTSPPSAGQNLVMLQLSFMEIYNEQVRDLLKQRPKNAILRYKSRFDTKDVDSDEYRTLKVRHHPTKGIYVEGLTTVAVRTWEECEAFLQQGNALRTQASTAMNAKSSRSHAIFQLQITQRESTGGRVRGKDVALETFSKVNLVDLAGSERNTQSKTTGKHLAEANSINASLSTLRRVLEGLIANRAIAAGSPGGGGAGGGKAKKSVVIPYRESLLTYVLSDNLGGNSFTVMCANVSPCASSAGETESTLRYATLARGVVNHAKLNEDPTARVMREMRDQLRVMQEALRTAPDPTHVAELEEGIQISENLLREMRSREERYELQLQEQAEKADALRRSAESHKRQEAFWKAEAEKQQRQVEALQAALLAAAAAATPRAKQTGKTAKGKKSVQRSASPPLQVDDDDGDTRNGSDDEHYSNGNTPTTTPTAKRKKKMKLNVPAVAAAAARRRRSVQSNDSSSSAVGAQGNDRGDASSGNVDNASHDLLSPASREWQPPRTRGTPLSLMGGNSGGGGKGNHKAKPRPSRTSVLPALPGAPSTAPERTRRASRSGSTVATAPPSAAAGGGGGRRNQHRPSKVGAAPRPPLAKPTARRRRSSVAGRPSGKPVTASREGELPSVADQNDVADDDDDDRHDAVDGPVDNDERDVKVKNVAGNGHSSHAVPRAPPAHLAEAAEEPSFYQTEQFLSQAAAAEAEVESAAQTTEESFAMDHIDVTTTYKAAVVATVEDGDRRPDDSLSHHHHHLRLGKTPESREALPMQVELADALRKRNGKGKHRQHDVKDSAVGGPVLFPGKAPSSPHAAEEAATDTFSAGHDDDGAAEREEEEDRDSMHGRHALDESGAGSDFAPPFPRRGDEVRAEEEEEQAASPAEYVEDFIADDTDTPAASFDRSGKLRDVAAAAAAAVAVAASSGDGDGGVTKKKKKHKSTKGKGKSQRDGSPGVEDEEDVRRSRHYSTIDTLLY